MSTFILPRLLRLHDAPAYVGMDRMLFEQMVRPTIMEIPMGKRGIGFDRIDLDAWVENHKARNARPGKGAESWAGKTLPPASPTATVSGISPRPSTAIDFEKALELTKSKKRKSI